MKRLHNTDSIEISLNKKYSQKDTDFKPRGLWYAIDNEWLEWCLDNMSHWIKENVFELEIDISKIIVISNKTELNNFIKKFTEVKYECLETINWNLVKEEYNGIEIVNYNHLKYNIGYQSFHNFPTWFYGWDVSGGCIWNLSIIKDIKKYETNKLQSIN
jgi:hypothetical protein